MRKRFFKACYAVSAAAGLTVALSVGAVGASASVAAHHSHRVTVNCTGGLGASCVSPDMYNPLTPTNEYVMTATAATSNAPIVVSYPDVTDPMQDWQATDLGTVGNYWNLAGPGNPLGITANDAAAFPKAQMFIYEFAPDGFSSGFCAANKNDALVTRPCNGLRWQLFIEAGSADGIFSADADGFYFLSGAQVFDAPWHLAMTGSRIDGTPIVFTHVRTANNEDWDNTEIKLII